MNGDHDTRMAAHAAQRGPVTVTHITTGATFTGTLHAWRPRAQPRTPGATNATGKYRARVLAAGSLRTYNLNRYTVEPA